jgi:hypothetical protein
LQPIVPQAPEPDLLALIAALNRHQVDYVLVGGMAALVYGATRPTEDLDIVARDTDDNMERMARALNEVNARSDVADHASLFDLRAMNTRWSTDAGTVDVLVSAAGPATSTINWRTLEPTAQTIAHSGYLLHIVSLEDLLEMKLSVGRPRDIAVAEQLVPGSSEAFAQRRKQR